jgi:hypothetical protein
MKQPLRLIDMLALKTLAVGVAFVQRNPAGSSQIGSDSEGLHSSQFQYFIKDTELSSPQKLAAAIYRLVCRTNFAAPGYALVRQTKIQSSRAQRESLVELKENLSHVHQTVAGSPLGWFSLNRFDQKTTTRPHRDAGPAQSLLLLGYEPSKVTSDMLIADYSACAHQLGLSPVQFLEEFNPKYQKGMQNLAPYIMPLVEFDPSFYNILVVNNSSTPLNRQEFHWQGVLHCAEIYGNSTQPRVINSTSIRPLGSGEEDIIDGTTVQQFLTSDKLDQAGY